MEVGYNLNHFIEEVIKEVDDKDIVGDLLYEEPTESRYEECCIMVFNIPIIGEERLEKLKKVLSGVFSLQNMYKFNDYYPLSEDGKTKGYCFLEYETKEAASAVRTVCEGYKLDKNHTFSSYPFSALRDLKEPTANWKMPEKRTYVDLGDRWWWLQNPKCLDQFATQYEDENEYMLEVFTHAKTGDPLLVQQRGNWSEDSNFKWTPYGSYLATLHSRGVILWGGKEFTLFQRFEHGGVKHIEFSPKESYLVTYACNTNSRDNEMFKIFDAFTGELKKTFSPFGKLSNNSNNRPPLELPFIKWSNDEKFFAFSRANSDNLNLFNTEDFKLCDNKVVELEGLVNFCFNSTKNLIAYYCEEKSNANRPAEIGIMEIPSRTKLRAQRIFGVFQINIFWQKSGLYLAAHTERYQKLVKNKEEVKYTGVTSHLEIFDCTEKSISVLTLQLPEPFLNFEWEAKGNKFCVLVGSTLTKITPLIYRYDKGKPVPQFLSKIEPGNGLNSVSWAPQGGWLIVYGASTPGGLVYFIDASGTEATRIRSIEHPSLTQAFWDPTGRYLTICSFGGKSRYETGYRIYTFLGREILRKNIDSLLQFKWRPRPPVQLSEQKIREIRKTLKQKSLQFEEEDKRELLKVSKEIIELRQSALALFAEIRKRTKAYDIEEREERMALRGGKDLKQSELDLVEETITIALNTEIEKLEETNTAKSEDLD
ncbi:Eukaryotic translation initiation factor 3 subunit B [Meloidogyne graminicola]|uniref:Eukaryotic translation initiation factor 3 subunit B n=1 Tax=Meloidogyne graminicola TaxID=189291 RepID=A0A8S9ZUF7_9BILA|nr:Eukaryotic translation initiation factor 3 subunit B [Meloidogyne graminicola]